VSIVVDSSEKKLIGWPEKKRPNSGGGGEKKEIKKHVKRVDT
jgi:hypothetical protein